MRVSARKSRKWSNGAQSRRDSHVGLILLFWALTIQFWPDAALAIGPDAKAAAGEFAHTKLRCRRY